MDCTSCGRANRTGARFCGGCGAALSPRCPACGSECEAGAGFCDACGAPLAAQTKAPAAEARKVVTIVFADLMGSTALHERIDPESARAFMERYYAAMRDAVQAERGQVTQLLGDGVKAVFGAPRVAEDDALRAVRAAVAMQRAFRPLADAQRDAVGDIGLRVAVNTGEVVAQDEREIIGDPVNVAAHLQAQAGDGDVLVGESTQRLVAQQVTLERVGTFTLKGRAEPVAAWRVTSLERPAGAPATAFVGRDDELRRVLAVYEAAASEKRARLAVVLGSPGLGKSRLLAELARRLGNAATLLAARCDATGGATFEPLAEALRAHLCGEAVVDREGVRAVVEAALPSDTVERPRIAAGVVALLTGSPASPEETFFVVRRLLATLAGARPVVLVIDDLHWAEPLLLDFVEHLVQWGGDVPLLVLAAARPELRDRRSSLAARGGLVSEALTLAGLDAGAATRLAANAIGADELPAAIAGRVLAASEGNPLFVGELARMLVQDGALVREGDRWITRASLADLEMPPTIQALLAARIERLRPEERAVLERAAVVGRHFSRAAVAELLPPELRRDLDARLEALRRSELIESDTGWLLGEPVLRFHHVLIRDAAYRRLLKGTRADLHTRFADWLAARVGEAPEHDEMLGWHLEQAHALLCELGPLDPRGYALGARAAGHLAAAGRRALARDDLSLAAGLLGRALERLAADSPARAELALDWCETLLAAGDVGPAARALDELRRLAGDSARLRAWHTCFAAHLAALTDPQALGDTADAVASAAQRLAAEGDAAGEAKAHSVHALVLSRLGRIGASEGALDLALAAARRGRDRRRSNAVLAGAPLAALWGPSPVTRASGRCLDVVRVLRITQGAPAVEAVALRCQGVLEALRGRADAARRMVASSRRLVEELGITQRLLEAELFAGRIELLEGDFAAAERCLRTAYDGLRAQGLDIDAAQAAALLGRALLAQDRADDALALSRESEQLAGDDRIAGIAWRCVRAEVLARRGEHAAAVEVASRAVALGAATDALLDHADARMALAVALRAVGRAAEAGAEEARAISLWEAKGATLLVERARGAARPTPLAPPVTHVQAATPRRLVRANAAVANAARVEAAVAARSLDGYYAALAEGADVVHHATGVSYTESEARRANEVLMAAPPGMVFEHEPLATLGDSLALLRWRLTGAEGGGPVADLGDVGESEGAYIVLADVDARGLRRRTEFFSSDRLGNAILRLYERYAELQPAGAARECAEQAARSVALMMGQLRIGTPGGFDAERAAESFADGFEATDHRRASFGAARGAPAFLRALVSASEVADDLVESCDDVLALQPDALLLRRTLRGRSRAGGGAFEAPTWNLARFDAEGRFLRAEFFDPEQHAEALARFEALTAPPEPVRRVRANAATRFAARLDAVVAAKDVTALHALFAEGMQVVHHPTDTRFGREGALSRFEALMRADDLRLFHEPLAALGDSLALCRAGTSVRALAEDDVAPAGPIESETRVVIEVDAQGRECGVEIFAGDRLADALTRLYELRATQLPDGPQRARGANASRVVAAMFGSLDLERAAAVVAPDVASMDHRRTGFGEGRGAAQLLRALATAREIGDGLVGRIDDVIAATPEGVLVRWTSSGRDRDGGGSFEWSFLRLCVFGADGLLAHYELFDPEREADALARFARLAPAPTSVSPSSRRVWANAATVFVARFDAAIAAADRVGLAELMREDMQLVHHGTGTEFDREGVLARFTSMFTAENLRLANEPIAALGDSLALCRAVMSASALESAGAIEGETFVLIEVDARGRQRRTELFPDRRLGDAIARLYARHAEQIPEGPERERAATTARSVATLVGPLDLDRYAAALAPDVEYVDRRRMGIGAVRGADVFLRGARTLVETASDFGTRVDDVLALLPHAFLMRSTTYGIDRASGGAYERPLLVLAALGADGRATRIEWFDPDADAEALQRFDALTGGPPPVRQPRVANAAWRVFERARDRWRARDWEGVRSAHAPGCTMEDRRSRVRLQLSSGEFFTNQRMLFDAGSIAWSGELLATRGERLALLRVRFEGEALVSGQLAIDHLSLMEADAQGRCAALVLFDPADLDAACEELDARFAAEAGPAYAWIVAFRQAQAARDWDAVRAQCAPDFVLHDHRAVGWEALRGGEAWVEMLRALVELAPDVRQRVDHLTLSERASLMQMTWLGTREGGAFEESKLIVSEWGPDGRFRRVDQYEVDQLPAARARHAELCAPARRIGNLATRAEEQACEAVTAHDWDRFAALFAPHFRSSDRRRLMRLELDREELLEPFRPIFEMRPRRTHRMLATRGDHLALVSVRLEVGDSASGPSVVEFIQVMEVDDRGLRIAAVGFDPDDVDAAYAELDSRYAAQQRGLGRRTSLARAFTEAFAGRDWSALAALLAPDLVVNDHRRLGWEPLHGPDAYVQALRELTELAPDVTLRVDHAEMRQATGYLYFTSWQGTREGGAFEEPSWIVCELDAEGRIRRSDQYGLEQESAARARLAQIAAANTSRDPLRIPPNAASRAMDGHERALATRSWDALEAGLAPDMTFDDRRRGVLVSGDRDQFMRGCRMIGATQVRLSTTLLATAGERLALQHAHWTGSADGGGAYEAENLSLVEVDAEGRIAAIVSFDADERRAAADELFERYARGEGAQKLPPAMIEAFRAQNAHDFTALRAALPADFVFHDHRRTGLGSLGVDAWIASLTQLLAQAPDLAFETLTILASETHAELALGRMFGTQTTGGAFEGVHLRLSHFDAERVIAIEVFEPEQLDAARARFEALRPAAQLDLLRIPPNAATRATDRLHRAVYARDPDAAAAEIAPGMLLEDRRRGIRLVADRDQFLVSSGLLAAARARASRTLLATAGERLALERFCWSGSSAQTGRFEAETLTLTEVDEEDRIAAMIVFDPDGRRAASAEMRERFFRGEGARFMPVSSLALMRAWDDHDLARVRAAIPDDFYLQDHRRTGVGRVDGAHAYVESVSALFENSPDLAVDTLYQLELEEHASLSVGRTYGRLAEGGAVESVFLRLNVYTGGRAVGMELFELEDLPRARARFEALRPQPTSVPPNAVTHAFRRFAACVAERDWQGLMDLHAPEFVYEDRRALVRDTGDREKLLASVRVAAGAGARESHTLLATAGDRLALVRQLFEVVQGDVVVSQLEALQVVELGVDGRFVAAVAFDLADRAAADAELRARFEAQQAADARPAVRSAPVLPNQATRARGRFQACVEARDWPALKRLLAPEFAYEDRRPLMRDSGDREKFVASAQLSHAAGAQVARTLLATAGQRLELSQLRFTVAKGGEVVSEIETLQLAEVRADGCITAMIVFDVADRAAADAELRARYEAQAAR